MLRAVCSWFAEMAGVLVRRPGLALVMGVVLAGSASMMGAAGGLPGAFSSNLSDLDKYRFGVLLQDEPWAEGYSAAAKYKPFNGGESEYWVIFKGTVNPDSHVDSNAKPVAVKCLHIYGDKAQRDSVGLIPPHPYFLGFLLWPEVMVKCAQPGQPFVIEHWGEVRERATAWVAAHPSPPFKFHAPHELDPGKSRPHYY
jgi:hypothetical protein